MKSVRYKKWDGSQAPFELKRKSIVETFLDNIMKGMNPRASLAQMMWSGFPLAGMNFRVMGIEEMIQELQKQVVDLFAKYHLENVFDQPISDFKNLLSQEQFARHEKGLSPAPSYEQLPAGLLEKLKQLENFDFLNNDSRQIFTHWQNRRADILDLYEFYGEYADKFTGPEPVDFDQALELMRLLKSIEKIQKQIMNGQFSTIDPQALQEILGENAAKSFNILLELPQMMTEEGIVDSLQKGFDMTPRGMRALGELAFGKIYRHIKRDKPGGQSGNAPHSGEIEPDSSRRYRYGDRFDLDISKTILNAVSKGRYHHGRLKLSPDDFHIREREQLIRSTTVVLLDLSWSMSWEGRFEAAKKVALALNHYIRSRFPKDKLHIVGFCTEAHELKGGELALAQWDPARPFTNLQDGLRLAMQLIKKSGNRNNRVIVITDGQPTAYFDRDQLHVELPDNFFGLSPNACKATLAEVRKVTAQGMNIETFMLDNNPVLVEFTRELTRINGGRAVLCLPGELGKLILIEEIKRRGGR
jgi:uncharacterized protein with von Willebrand factor type A (vWA) domain